MPKPEQTEKPSPKRLRDARGRGQVARSPDISSAAIFIAIIIALHASFMATMQAMGQGFQVALMHVASHDEPTMRSIWGQFARALLPYIMILAAAFAAAVAIGLLANILQFGLLFAPKLLQPKFGKLNPLTGFQRVLLSPQTLVQLFKQLAKLGVVLLIVYLGIKDQIPTFYSLAHASPGDIIRSVEGICFWIGIRFGFLLLVLGLADYAWEKRKLINSLKMSKQEVKEESKQSEGSPEAKMAVKQRQRASARRRMMASVPRATVVVTNPTHYAIALEWDEIKMAAPVLIAKGADLMAKRIREVAIEHGIPIMENPPLARTLYDKVQLDSPIPPTMYSAVAQVIAFVYKLKNRTIA
ncbi:MAG: flagellar biosynthesis protein FlhB [Candidatus Velthaea sp.]